MARKPAHLVSTSRSVGGRQGMWEAMRKRTRFTMQELAQDVSAEVATVRTYVDSLKAGGFVEIVGEIPGRRSVVGMPNSHKFPAKVYELVRDIGVEAPRVKRDGTPSTAGMCRDQMWRAMKLLTVFTPRELAINASTEEHRVSESDAKSYVGHLAHAGYLVVIRKAAQRQQATYRFVRNSGPRAPIVQSLKSVWDDNIRKVVWQKEPAE